MTRALVLSAAAVDAASIQSMRAALRSEHPDLEVDVISGTPGGSADVIALAPAGRLDAVRRAVQRRLGGSSAGRMFVRLVTLDDGHSFARRFRSDRSARHIATTADLIVAVDRDAQLTAWRLGRAGTAAVTGIASGVVALRSIGADPAAR